MLNNPLLIIGLVIAITIHEYAHALAADKLGDPTPRANGRLTLNPLRHLDPLGTIILIFANFGWGKPVPIDPYNFRQPRRDEIIVSLAGPISNFILAIILSKLAIFVPLFYYFAVINLYLGIFNLLPIPPLDGSKIFLNILPIEKAVAWEQAFDRYGFILLFILVYSGLIGRIIGPIALMLQNILF